MAMNSAKIIPIRVGQTPARLDPQQRDLFADPGKFSGHIIFVDISTLWQEKLLRILNKNAVQALVDIRKIPVFRKPKFNHKRLMDYITSRNISYFDFTSQKSRLEIGEAIVALLASQPHPLFGPLSKALDSGLTVILYDSNEDAQTSISDIRNLLKYHSSFRAELHPNALTW
jgi:hypothetical protein